MIDWIESSHKVVLNNPVRVNRWKNIILKGKTYDVLFIQRENGNGTKILGKSEISKETKKGRNNNKKGRRQLLGNCAWLSGRMHIEERRTIERRAAASTKASRRKRSKTKVTPEKDAMASANQTPGGYKFAPLVASQQGRANQHEPASFGLSSPWFLPSRSGIRLHAVVQQSSLESQSRGCATTPILAW